MAEEIAEEVIPEEVMPEEPPRATKMERGQKRPRQTHAYLKGVE